MFLDFPGGSDGKESAGNAGDLGSIPELGRSPGEINGKPLQYSCLEDPMDRVVHGITKSWIRLKRPSTHLARQVRILTSHFTFWFALGELQS